MEENYSPQSLKEKPNEELLRLAQRNVNGAYDIIYGRLYEKFVNTAQKILNNHADAEDAAQKALVAGYLNRTKFLFFSKTETWLTSILINKAKDIIRRNAGSKKAPEEEAVAAEEQKTREVLSANLDKVPGNNDYPDKKTRLMLMFLRECVGELPEEERITLELRELDNIPYKEIVKIANEKFGHSSLGNIRNKTDSAKKKLKNCVEKKLSSYEIIFEK